MTTHDDFLLSVSHDLKIPLTAIRGRVQLLQRRAARDGMISPVGMAKGLDEIEAATIKMQRMIDELQVVSSPHIERPLTLERKPTDLVTLTRDVVTMMNDISTRHRVTFVSQSSELIVDLDPGRIGRVLDNLIGNAIKYSPIGGEVVVRVARENGWEDGTDRAVITVRDSGIGIPAADQTRIFERFFRGSNVPVHIGGSGIGLAGAHVIVSRHVGTIEVASVEGMGSTFTVRLPAHVARVSQDSPAAPGRRRRRGQAVPRTP